jgi:hypothetical protein
MEPGAFGFVTTRCLESRLLLRPDPELRTLTGLWLSRALSRFPKITVYGAVAMSNHLHLLVRDGGGALPGFACYYLGNLARAVNRLRGRSGPVFHRRYDVTRVLDPRAAVRYLAYLVANPVRAGLVKRHDRWPGLLLYARNTPRRADFVWFDKNSYEKAQHLARSARRRPRPRDRFESRASLVVEPLPFEIGAIDTPSLLGGRSLFALDPTASAFINGVSDAPQAAPYGSRVFISASEAAYNEVLETERHLAATCNIRVPTLRTLRTQDPFQKPSTTSRSLRPVVLCDVSAGGFGTRFDGRGAHSTVGTGSRQPPSAAGTSM